MTPENDEYLVQTYPKLFANRYGSVRETLMCFGFECDDGWFNIINDLCRNIQGYLDDNPRLGQVQVIQVKEKFGELRFYLDRTDDTIADMIHAAMQRSTNTCEITGKSGRLCTHGGWLKTLCEEKALELSFIVYKDIP